MSQNMKNSDKNFTDQVIICSLDDSLSVSSLGSISSDDESDLCSTEDEDDDECPAHYRQRGRRDRHRQSRASFLSGNGVSRGLCSAPDFDIFPRNELSSRRDWQNSEQMYTYCVSDFTRSFSDLHAQQRTRKTLKVKRTRSVDDEAPPDNTMDRWAPASSSGRHLRSLVNDRWSPTPSHQDLAGSVSQISDHTPRNPRASMPSLLSRYSQPKSTKAAANAQWQASPPVRRRTCQRKVCSKLSAPDLLLLSPGLEGRARSRKSNISIPTREDSRWDTASSSLTCVQSILSFASNAEWSIQPRKPKRRPRNKSTRKKTRKSDSKSPRVITDTSDDSTEKSEREKPRLERAPSLDGIRFPSKDLDAEALSSEDEEELKEDSETDGYEQDLSGYDHGSENAEEDERVTHLGALLENESFRDENPFPNDYFLNHCETILEEVIEHEDNCPCTGKKPASDTLMRAPKRRKSDASGACLLGDESDASSSAVRSVVRCGDTRMDIPVHPSPRCPKKPTRRHSLLDLSTTSINSGDRSSRGCACLENKHKTHPRKLQEHPLLDEKHPSVLSRGESAVVDKNKFNCPAA